MRATLSWFPLLLLPAACSEYELGAKPSAGRGSTDTAAQTTDPTVPPGEDCPQPDEPGYDAPVDESCYTEVQTGTFTPVLEWEMQSFSSTGTEVMSTPIVVDVNQDATPDVVFVTYSPGTVRAVSGDGSRELWSQTGVDVQITGGVAAGDLDGDGLVEIVSLRAGGLVILENDGRIKTVRDNLGGAITGTSDVASISDMDHDGSPEIIAGRAILNADGTVRGIGAHGLGAVNGYNVGSCSFAVDLDLDGTEEVVTGNALYRPDGSTIWFNGGPDGYPAVGNFDADPEGEIAAVSGGELRVIDTDGTVRGRYPIPGAGTTGYGGPPTVADFDGDGVAEIGVAAGSRYTVFEVDGTIVWQTVTDDSSSGNTGSAVFDFEGDGVAEVVYADQTRLWVFDGRNGAVKLASADHSNATWLEYPTIADVDGDGHAEIITANTYYNLSSPRTGLAVFGDLDDSWQPGRRIWNQHAYFLTNVNDDGTIPRTAATNWATYNNFRSGDLNAGTGAELPNLIVGDGGRCEIDCDEGHLQLWVHPGNSGLADVPAGKNPEIELLSVSGGQETSIERRALPAVDAGTFQEAAVFDVTGLDFAAIDAFVARVSADGRDCHDDDDEYVWSGPFCATE